MGPAAPHPERRQRGPLAMFCARGGNRFTRDLLRFPTVLAKASKTCEHADANADTNRYPTIPPVFCLFVFPSQN